MCFANTDLLLLIASLALQGCSALGLLPVLQLLSAHSLPSQQARAAGLLFAVMQAAQALGLGTHSLLFHFAAGKGVLNAPFAVSTVLSFVTLAITFCAPDEVRGLGTSPLTPRGARSSGRESRERGWTPGVPGSAAGADAGMKDV